MTIKVKIFANGFEVEDPLCELITTKLNQVDYLPLEISSIQIDLTDLQKVSSSPARFVVQITIRGKEFLFRQEERNSELITAFETVLNKIQIKIEHYRIKHGLVTITSVNIPDSPQEEDRRHVREIELETKEPEPIIARHKHLAPESITEIEAIERMNLSDHTNFYIFYNSKTNLFNVVYSRQDHKTYGIIELERLAETPVQQKGFGFLGNLHQFDETSPRIPSPLPLFPEKQKK